MPLAKYAFEAIGTWWSIETKRELTSNERATVDTTIEQFDHTYSRFRPDSLVQQLTAGEPVLFPKSIGDIHGIYRTLYELSAGKINPHVGTSLAALGYDQTYSLRAGAPVPAPDFSQLFLNKNIVTLKTPGIVDIGAVGKGYLIDQVAKIVGKNHSEYVIDASGDIALLTEQPESIGLEHPKDPTKIIGTVHLARGALCASSTNRRVWGKGLHHILDATTGQPTNTDIVATWAIGPNATICDALTTGLFFVSPATLMQTFGEFFYVIMKQDGSVIHNLPPEVGEIFN